MRISLVITSLGVGGAERLVTALADRFAAAGHEVAIAYLKGPVEVRPTNTAVELINLKMSRQPLTLVGACRRLARLIDEFKPDVVNSHLVHANILLRLLRTTTAMPRLVSSAHNTNEESRLRMLAYRVTDSLADMSSNVSLEAVQAFRSQHAVPAGRMVAIPNGIDARTFVFEEEARQAVREELGVTDDVQVLLAIGRIRKEKDYPNLLRALATLHQAGNRVYLVIAGDGPLRTSLVELAETLGVSGWVRFLGIRGDVPRLLSACDVFVLSSAWEGFGLVVAEAMACERVVVATDSGGVREVVGDAGFVVPPRDTGALARGLISALDMPAAERVALGREARMRVVQHFSLDATAERYLDLYRA